MPDAHPSGDKRFKLLETRVAADAGSAGEPGTVLAVDGAGARVACAEGILLLVRGQLEGRKPLTAAELLAGRTLAVGTRFG